MGHPLKISAMLAALLSLALTACEDTDYRGFFVSDYTVSQRFGQSMEWNRTHPFREITVPDDDYTLMCMADSHLGGTVNLDTFVNRSRALNASAMVMAGDMVSGHEEDYELFQQHMPPQDSLPWFVIAGNHELYFDGWEQFYSRFGSSTYLFTVRTGEVSDLFICLDSGGGTHGKEQLDWLEDILKDLRPRYRYCIVFSHVNMFRPRHTGSTNPLVEELHVLLELFTVNRVDMVINGHDHKKNAQVFGSTTYIILDALMDGLSYAGYLQLYLSNDGIDYRFVNL